MEFLNIMYLYAQFSPARRLDGGRGYRRGEGTGACAPIDAGSVRPTSDVTARKPRYYGRFSQSVLWRDIMCEKTS